MRIGSRKMIIDALLALVACLSLCLGVWHLLPYQPRATLTGPFDWVVSWSPGGRVLLTTDAPAQPLGGGATAGPLRLWDVATGRERAVFFSAKDRLEHKIIVRDREETQPWEFSSDGRLFSVHVNHRLCVIDLERGQMAWELDRPGHVVWPPEFSPDGRLAAVWSFQPDELAPPPFRARDHALQLLDAASGKVVHEFRADEDPLSWAFSPDGGTLALTYQDLQGDDPARRIIHLWDVAGRRVRATLSGATSFRAFAPDGRFLVTDGQLWDATRGRLVRDLPDVHRFHFFSADSRFLATYGATTLRIFETAVGKEVATLSPGTGMDWIGFSPDGRWLLAESPRDDSRELIVWDTGSWQEHARLEGSSIGFAADNSTLLVRPTPIEPPRLINLETGAVRPLLDSSGRSATCNFLPDRRTVLIHSVGHSQPGPFFTWLQRWLPLPRQTSDLFPQEVKLANVRTGRETVVVTGTDIHHAVATADARTLITCHRLGASGGWQYLQLWNLPPGKPVQWLLLVPAGFLLLTAAAWCGRRRRQSRAC